MNWFQQNKFLGSSLAILAMIALLTLYFLWHEKSAANAQQARLETAMKELNRLRQGNPFPNGENLRLLKAQTDSYRTSLVTLETELKARTPALVPMQPNEFQAQLRQAANSIIERARESKVRLPENFFLGFDEYATSLPNSTAAPLLSRELKAIEWLAKTVIGAHVDSLSALTRVPLVEEKAAPPPTPVPAKSRGAKTARQPGETREVAVFDSIDLAFSASPTAARKVLNQIVNAREQLFIIRTLVVKNQVPKGPARGQSQGATVFAPNLPPSSPAERAGATPAGTKAINFIVGTEHIDLAAKIELVNFTLPGKESR